MSSFIADKIVMDGLTFDDVLRESDGYCHCS